MLAYLVYNCQQKSYNIFVDNGKGGDNMEQINWVEIISNQAFPMVVTGYLLMRFDKKIDKLSDSIIALVEHQKMKS